MAKGHKGPGMGRPKLEWSETQENMFNALMGIPFVTEEAICEVLKISRTTLQRRIREVHDSTFESYKKQKHEGMKMRLAGKQFESAMKGNTTMMVWLGKQWLGQTDKQETKISGQMEQKLISETPQEQLERIKGMVKDELK